MNQYSYYFVMILFNMLKGREILSLRTSFLTS